MAYGDLIVARIGETLYGHNVAYLPFVPSDLRSYKALETIRVDTFKFPRVFGMTIGPSPDRSRKESVSLIYVIDDLGRLQLIEKKDWSIMLIDMDPERVKPLTSDRFTVYYYKSLRLPWSDAQMEGTKKTDVYIRTFCFKSQKAMQDKKFRLQKEYHDLEKRKTIEQYMDLIPETLRRRIGEYMVRL